MKMMNGMQKLSLSVDYQKAGLVHTGPEAQLALYLLDGDEVRPLILICPGGGYDHLSARESEPIARKMNALGYQAAVLTYSLVPNRYPTQLLEVAAAVGLLRERAWDLKADPEKIAVMGFSAGAHVAGSLGTCWEDELLVRVLGGTAKLYRPYAQILCYPVITSGEYAHRGSFACILGDAPSEELLARVSLEKRVDEGCAPTFIWHTFADTAVPVENSLLMASALRKAGVKTELHIFQNGKHGLALGTAETDDGSGSYLVPECTVWPELMKTWLDGLS